METMEQEIEIDLKDLCGELLRRWYLFVIALVIGAVIGALYADQKQGGAVALTPEEVTEAKRAALTEGERREVEMNYELYQRLQTLVYALDETQEVSNGEFSKEEAELLRDVSQSLSGLYSQYTSHFTTEQKAYYDALVREKGEAAASYSTVKYALIGAFALAMLLAVGFAMIYIFSPQIKTAGELTAMYGLPILGTMGGQQDEEAERMLAADIGIGLRHGEHSSLALCVLGEEARSRALAERIEAQLKETEEIQTVAVIDPLSDPKSLRKLSEQTAAIPLVCMKKERRDTVAKLVGYCKRYGVEIPGFVIV